MPLQSSEPKGLHWERVSLPIISTLTPGTYTVPQITVDEYGRITNAFSGAGAAAIGGQDGGVPVTGGPFNTINFIGSNVTATDGGSGTLDVSVSNAGSIVGLDEGVVIPGGPFTSVNFLGVTVAATDGGGGQLDVTVFPNNPDNVQWVKASAGTVAFQNIGAPIDPTGIVRTVTVTVTGAYDPGTTLEVRDGLGNILMPSALINPLLAGIYSLEIPENLVAIIDPQVQLVVGNAPVTGACVVEVIYQVP